MRFITEFDRLHPDFIDKRTSDLRLEAERSLGWFLIHSFGLTNPTPNKFRLEIEAFPMDKWIEFRNALLEELNSSFDFDKEAVIELLEKLESFGKPAGAAKEL